MKIKVTSYNKEKNSHEVINQKGLYSKVDFFVGCAIKVPTDPYIEEEYDKVANDLIGMNFDIDEACWSEQHQMYLPNDHHIK